MGCYNFTGNFSNLPIQRRDRIVLILGIRYETELPTIDGERPKGRHMAKADIYPPGDVFVPIALPIRGEYDDYGSIENIDESPAVDRIKDFFKVDDINELFKWLERVKSDCGHQLDKRAVNILKDADERLFSGMYHSNGRHCIDYVMEHESVFDKLVSFNKLKIADNDRITEEMLEDIGFVYKKNVDEYSKRFKHETFGNVTLANYGRVTFLNENGKETNNKFNTLRSLCAKLEIPVPEKYEEDYFDFCIRIDREVKQMMDIASKKKFEDHETFIAEMKNIDDFLCQKHHPYTFMRYLELSLERNEGLFQSSHRDMRFLRFYPQNDLIVNGPAKEMKEIAALLMTMEDMQLTWGLTHSGGQVCPTDQFSGFLDACMKVVDGWRDDEDYDEDFEDDEDDLD